MRLRDFFLIVQPPLLLLRRESLGPLTPALVCAQTSFANLDTCARERLNRWDQFLSPGAFRYRTSKGLEHAVGIRPWRQVEYHRIDEFDGAPGPRQREIVPPVAAQKGPLESNRWCICPDGEPAHRSFGCQGRPHSAERKRLDIFFRPPLRRVAGIIEPRDVLDLNGARSRRADVLYGICSFAATLDGSYGSPDKRVQD